MPAPKNDDPETLLRALLKGFYQSEHYKGILWGWREDVTVGEALSPELQEALQKYMEKERDQYPLPKK